MHVRAERALNYLSELTERILLTDRKIGNEVVLAFAAYIVCDGNIVEASKLAHISKEPLLREVRPLVRVGAGGGEGGIGVEER